MKKNIRIKDIAKSAGVSTGTVDRVLHNRGKVSEEALSKVMNVLNSIEYKPNLIARMLGTYRSYQIAVLIPDPSLDSYWNMAMKGITQGEAEWSQYGIHVHVFTFEVNDKDSFLKRTDDILKTNPDGVLVAPIFYHEALPFLEACHTRNIPFVSFNTHIIESKPLCFFGQNLYQSGRVAAELVCVGQEAGEFAILHFDEDLDDSVHLLEKERGFRDYVHEKFGDTVIHSINRTSSSDTKFRQQLDDLLSRPQLKGLFVSSSMGTSTAASILQEKGKNDIRFVGYDLLDENIKFLESGTIDFLINQKPQQQTFLGLSCLANHLIFKKKTPEISLFSLEIITRQNLSSYLQDREVSFLLDQESNLIKV